MSESSGNSSGIAGFTVQRGVGSTGTNIVYWEVESAGRLDLTPASGNLTFMEVRLNPRVGVV